MFCPRTLLTTRTVTDAAILYDVLSRGRDHVPGDKQELHHLVRGELRHARIGVDRRYFEPDLGGEPAIVAVVEEALTAMRHLGATVLDTDTGNPFAYGDAELTVLLYEFKVQIAQYMATLGHTTMRTLADLIAFDLAHCNAEMKYFGQEIFEMAEATSGDLSDPVYLDARARCVRLARTRGIDAALARDQLDAIVAPSYSFASSPAAVAGYPNISVPIGLTSAGGPAGIWMYAGANQEAKLLRLAYDLEQELDARTRPQFRHHVPPKPPDAGICPPALTAAPRTSSQSKLRARTLRML